MTKSLTMYLKHRPTKIGRTLLFVVTGSLSLLTRAQAGSLDLTFDPMGGPDQRVRCIALQTDGKILIGGDFTNYNGTARGRIARLNADGSLDTSFDPGSGANFKVISISVQTNGKIVIGGEFTTYDGATCGRIARLNSDGNLDPAFDTGTGAADMILTTALQSDGKILVAGLFTSFNGIGRFHIARLNPNGSLDSGFNTAFPGGANNSVSSLALQPDGKVVLGGDFTQYWGQNINRIARGSSSNSVIDSSFDTGTGANASVLRAVISPAGKIIVGGSFTSYDGTPRNSIARLNTDGSLDTGFDPGAGANGSIGCITFQPDGKVIIGGYFTSYDGIGRNGIARLGTDGSLDPTFDPGSGTNVGVSCLLRQPNGGILIGGAFTDYNGTLRNRLARVHGDDASGILADATQTSAVRVFPNPTSDRVTVLTGMNGAVKLLVRDLSGRALLQESRVAHAGHEMVLSLAGIPSGTYLLEVGSSRSTSTTRLVKD